MASDSLTPFTSFSDALDYYYDFLRGIKSTCHTHDGPLETESNPLVPALLRINRAGFLSIDSQPSSVVSTTTTINGRKLNGKRHAAQKTIYRSRGYLYGVVGKEGVQKLLLKLDRSKYAIVTLPLSSELQKEVNSGPSYELTTLLDGEVYEQSEGGSSFYLSTTMSSDRELLFGSDYHSSLVSSLVAVFLYCKELPINNQNQAELCSVVADALEA